MRTDDRGLALVDIVATLSLVLTTSAITVPVIGRTLEREYTVIGARHLAGLLMRARAEALRRSTAVAARFETVDDRTRVRLFADGNGNGVLQRDIDRGTDRPVSEYEWLDVHGRDVSLRINQSVVDPGGTGILAPGSDPLRIGRSAFVTFGPLGGSSSGTLFVATRRGPQMAIRVFGGSGRVRVLTFDPRAGAWRL